MPCAKRGMQISWSIKRSLAILQKQRIEPSSVPQPHSPKTKRVIRSPEYENILFHNLFINSIDRRSNISFRDLSDSQPSRTSGSFEHQHRFTNERHFALPISSHIPRRQSGTKANANPNADAKTKSHADAKRAGMRQWRRMHGGAGRHPQHPEQLLGILKSKKRSVQHHRVRTESRPAPGGRRDRLPLRNGHHQLFPRLRRRARALKRCAKIA